MYVSLSVASEASVAPLRSHLRVILQTPPPLHKTLLKQTLTSGLKLSSLETPNQLLLHVNYTDSSGNSWDWSSGWRREIETHNDWVMYIKPENNIISFQEQCERLEQQYFTRCKLNNTVLKCNNVVTRFVYISKENVGGATLCKNTSTLLGHYGWLLGRYGWLLGCFRWLLGCFRWLLGCFRWFHASLWSSGL